MVQYSDIKKYISSKAIQGVILDFDRTLHFLDSDYSSLRREINKYLETTQIYKSVSSLSEVIKIKKNNHRIYYEKILPLIMKYELEGYKKGYLNKDIFKLINEFKGKLAIYSMNSLMVIKKYLTDNGVERRFDTLYSQETLTSPKPSNIEIESIIRKWRLNKDVVIFIGDSEADRQSGAQSEVATFIIDMNIHPAI